MARAVCADPTFRSATVDGAIAVDDVMIANAAEAALAMPAVYLLDGEVLAFGCSRAMNDDLGNASHLFMVYC